MGFLTTLHESRSYWNGPYSLKDPALNKLFNVGRSTVAGVTVTDEVAMMYSAVFSAVNVLSSDIAKAPLNLRKVSKQGGSEPYEDSPVYQLLKHEPNPEMGAMNFRQALTAHALTLGGGFAEIERNGAGRPIALWPIVPSRIKPVRDKGYRGDLLYYLVDNKTELDAADVLHLHGLGYDGTCGYALLEMARQAVGLGLAAERFSADFFGNNSAFGGVIGFNERKDPEELKEYRKAIEDGPRKSERAFGLLLLDDGAKFTPFGMSNTDAQLNELRTKQVEEVSRYYRIPLHKLNNLERATFSNVEQQDLEYYKGPVLDWMTLWEQECNRKLIARSERRLQYFKHNANVFLRGDIASRYQALGIARDKGIINANEWRELEDMNPQDGEQGNQYLVQSAQVPADKIGPMADAQIAKTENDAKPKPAPVADPNLTQRAEDAERLAGELRAELVAHRESTEAKTAEYLQRERALQGQLEAAEIIAETVRAELAQATEAREAAVAAQSTETEARIAAERAATEANERATRAEAANTMAIADLTTAHQRAADLERAAQVATEQAHAATVDKAAAEAMAQEARATAQQALDRVLEAERAVAASTASLTEARASVERAAHETATATIAEALAEAARQQAEKTEAESARQTRVIQSMHDERVRIMRGALDRECDRARRAQQTPEKLRQWIANWYDGHAELMVASLLPSIRTHLAFIGSDADAGDLARELVAAHVAQSRRQVAGVADLDGDALAAALADLLHRWETERPQTIPDALMEKELAYVRS